MNDDNDNDNDDDNDKDNDNVKMMYLTGIICYLLVFRFVTICCANVPRIQC